MDVNIVEEHAQSISRTNTVVQARRMTRRISVVSLPPGIRKVIGQTMGKSIGRVNF